ncbi:glycosyltransferase family 2 protein [Priestia megaterium]|uniref:glycosyltransferase family 2 protein n=1 Tax=Priestia megaterium TaxID=1404 RepID=UPI0036DF3C28
MLDVSIIIPVFKVEEYLERCIDGILSQTHNNFELILVNDGSPDNCGSICEEYSAKDNRITVIHQKNQGTGMARNSGLKVAKGKYIYFCDPDDYVESTLLEDNFRLAEEYNANMVVFGYYDEMHTKDNSHLISKSMESMFLENKSEFRNKFPFMFQSGMMFTLWNKLYNREFLNKNGYLFENQRVGQDTIFNYKVYQNLDRVFINDNIYYHYIIDRTDSAVNMYRENRFELRYQETLKLEEMIKKWNQDGGQLHESFILNDWIVTLGVGLNNLFYQGCPLNNNQKKVIIQNIANSPKINHLLNNKPIKEVNSLFMKLEMFLLRQNFIKSAFILLKTKNIIKKSFIGKLNL